MNQDLPHIDAREKPTGLLRIDYSPQLDAETVRDTLDDAEFLQTQGYPFRLPATIEQVITSGKQPTDEEIFAAVQTEWKPEQYEQLSQGLTEAWREKGAEFLQKLLSLGLPTQAEYNLVLTRYGSGGMYNLPNRVVAIVNEPIVPDLHMTFHEIVHLTIEPLIREHGIDHWTKERLVDSVLNNFYPQQLHRQRDPANTVEVDTIFNQYYPDMTRVSKEIATVRDHQE